MDEWYSVAEAAKVLEINRTTLYDWRDKGIIKLYAVKGKSKVKKSDVESILQGIQKTQRTIETGGEWLTIQEALAFLGIHRSTLYDLSERGVLPIYKMAGKSVIKRIDAEEYKKPRRLIHKSQKTTEE